MLPVMRRSPWLSTAFDEPVHRLRNEVDGLFDHFFGNNGAPQAAAWAGVPLSMWEDENHVYIEVEVPGLTEKDIEASVHNGMLSLAGERHPKEGRTYLYNTRAYGRFERLITLPSTVDADKIQAKLNAGVLQIQLTKSAAAKPRKIAVQAG